MASETLKAIMKHWTAPLPPEDGETIKLPFNVEEFCRENDEKLAALERLADTSAPGGGEVIKIKRMDDSQPSEQCLCGEDFCSECGQD